MVDITINDIKNLKNAFNMRINDLDKLASENPDLKEMIDLQIQDYGRTLNKYRSFGKDE